jgi:hypothetical protein
MTHHRVPLLLAAVTLVLLLLQPCSSSVTAEEDMIQWIRAAGGEVGALARVCTESSNHAWAHMGKRAGHQRILHLQVNVEVATVDGLRGTAVTEDIPKGGTLALVPQSTMYVASSNKSDSLMVRRCDIRMPSNSSGQGRPATCSVFHVCTYQLPGSV